MFAALTFDLEKDCCPAFPTAIGMEMGLPKIISLLEKYKIECTFFATGEIAESYPETLKEIVKKHELACHSYFHETFDKMTVQKTIRIEESKNILQRIVNQEIIGFRAPNFMVSGELYQALTRLGFRYDSSLTWFKPQHLRMTPPIQEFRVQLPSAFLNFPLGPRVFMKILKHSSFPVMCFHCWEAIDVRSLLTMSAVNSVYIQYFRPDMWVNTGNAFLGRLESLIASLLKADFHFVRLRDYGHKSETSK
jgi:peptidoglycan/xylan/chitin deacetylase (PgdA/CDA1 family)